MVFIDRPIQAPLSELARRKRPLASGDPTNPAFIAAPAESPMMVTRLGSPPKAAMFFFTHRSASAISMSA